MLYRIFLCVLVMSSLTCLTCRGVHPWFKDYDQDHFFKGNKINIYYIEDELKPYYITKLKDVEYIIINREEAEKISISPLDTGLDEDCFIIVRALYSILGGYYSATLSEANELLISYRVLAKWNYKDNKDVLLLALKAPPEIVYIISGMTS